MKMVVILLLLLLPMGGCAAGRGATTHAKAHTCGAPISGLDDIARPDRIVLFGEWHGTREIPAFVADAVCQAAGGGPVLLGLEISRSEQSRIDAYVASPAGDRAALLEGPFWHREFQDGRSSAAMADLIEHVRALRASGRDVRVLAFDVDDDARGPDRDAQMAKRILDAHAESPTDRLLVLAGNVHTRTTVGTPWNPAFEPMGLHLTNAGVEVVSLDAAFEAGTAWVCYSGDAAECGPKPAKKQGDVAAGTIARLSTPSKEGFHGHYGVGAISAASPAVPKP